MSEPLRAPETHIIDDAQATAHRIWALARATQDTLHQLSTISADANLSARMAVADTLLDLIDQQNSTLLSLLATIESWSYRWS